ncbi:hypothetical protein DDW01_01205 [Sulfolobus sp. SCGC AB-777_G05]|jgi:CHAD domain-containing protein|nr:hypothetical protein DDW01_01205 [Sulfolobus sp. SCGC AB-777_G05]
MRPEDYANKNLKEAIANAGRSEEEIHDMRVNLRKYYVVSSSLSKLYYDRECLYLAKRVLKKLGIIRDFDVIGCYPIDREKEVRYVLDKIRLLSNCYLPKLYGSRLAVYERVYSIYEGIRKEEFHGFRKKVRNSYYLLESVGEELSRRLKEISRELGEMRDKAIKSTCNFSANIPYDENIVLEVKAIIREAIMKSEFEHLKNRFK